MSYVAVVATVLLAWCLLSLPVALVTGKVLARRAPDAAHASDDGDVAA